MRAWFRHIVVSLNSSYWFLPAVLTVAALLLAGVTLFIDFRIGPDWVNNISYIQAAKPDGARSLLSTTAGSMISVAGTVFAITIAAVVYASGNYGPRLLTNFMTDRGNQLSLGVFIATYVYCLMVLRAIRQPDETGPFGLGQASGGFVPEVSLLVASLLTLLSVAVLVYFLHHVPDSIRINSVVASVGRRAIRDIKERYPETSEGTEPEAPVDLRGRKVCAKSVGYIEVIDFDTLADVVKDQGGEVYLSVRTGDFVHPNMPLLVFDGTLGEGIDDDLRAAFVVGESRTASQDIEYSLDELVEIGLRALSPGINDPFTAVTCLHWLSAATAALGARDLCRDADGRRYGEGGVHALADDFAHFVRRGFGAIRISASQSAMVSRVYVQTLEAATLGCTGEGRVAALAEQAALLLAQAESGLTGPALEELRNEVRAFQTRLARPDRLEGDRFTTATD